MIKGSIHSDAIKEHDDKLIARLGYLLKDEVMK